MIYILYLLLSVVVVVLIMMRIKYFDRDLNLNIFDGLFFGGVFYLFIPLFYYSFINQDVLPEYNYGFDVEVKDIKTSLYIFISIFLFGICSIIWGRKNRSYTQVSKNISKNEFFLFFTILILYLISQVIFFFKSGKLDGDTHWYHSNDDVFQSGVIYTFIGQFNNVGRLLLPAIGMYFEIKYKSRNAFRMHLLVSCILIPIELFITGNRISLLYIGISHLIPFMYQKRYKLIFYSCLLAIPLYFVSSFWPVIRGLMWSEKFSTEHALNIYQSTKSLEGADPVITFTEGHNLFIVNYICTEYPHRHDFVYGNTLIIKSIGSLVPKRIWTDKPDGIGRDIGKYLLPHVDNMFLNATLIGETWANFGWFGNIVLLFIVFMAANLKVKFLSTQLINYIMFFSIIGAWRFETSFIVITLITLYIYILVSKIKVLRIIIRKCMKQTYKKFILES